MSTTWQIKRSLIARSEGQRRWDCAYQLLMRWAMEQATETRDISLPDQEDNDDGNSALCASIDQSAATEPKH